MTGLAVAFTLYLCPGVVTVLGIKIPLAKLPDSVKPALAVAGVCTAQPALEVYSPERAAAAYARVRALGAPAQLYQVREDAAVSPPLVTWHTYAEIKEPTP